MSDYSSESEESFGCLSVADSVNFVTEQEGGFASADTAGARPIDQLEDETDLDVAEPYGDEPLADEEWLEQYEAEIRFANEDEARLRRRLEGTDIVENWCKCGHCSVEKLENPNECKCCQEVKGCTTALFNVEVVEEYGKVPECVTLHPGFSSVCLCKWTLRLAAEKYKTKLNARYKRIISESKFMRAVAYRQFTRLIHGWLGERRIPLPACTYHAIRSKFPTNVHVGFQENN